MVSVGEVEVTVWMITFTFFWNCPVIRSDWLEVVAEIKLIIRPEIIMITVQFSEVRFQISSAVMTNIIV